MKHDVKHAGHKIQYAAEEAEAKTEHKVKGIAQILKEKIFGFKEAAQDKVHDFKTSVSKVVHPHGQVIRHEEVIVEGADEYVQDYEVTYEYHVAAKKIIKPHRLVSELGAL